jgi:TldD protein
MRDVAWRGGFRRFRGLEPLIDEMTGEAGSMASAVPAGAGVCPVILDQELAGAFAHEVFGHMSEGLPDDPDASVRHASPRTASVCISVVDDATHFEFPGSCAFDDEGIPGSRTTLVSGGSAGGRLLDLETAGRSGTRSTGNARSVDATSPPSPRMTCTYILPGSSKPSDLMAMMSDGLYLRGALTGSTDRDNFSLTARSAFEVRSGRIRKTHGPVTIAGRISDLANSVEAAGDDLELFSGTAGCSRAGTGYLPVSYGGPHLLLGRVRHADA